jgi:CHAT domain-containing protein/tetratricopeptide (TPR) repeat protein
MRALTRPDRGRWGWKRWFLSVWIAGMPAATVPAGMQHPVQSIHFEESVEGSLAGPGSSAWYEIDLNEGDFLSGIVDQTGVDVFVLIRPPGGLPAREFDSRWHGREPFWVPAESAGAYRIELRAMEKRRRDGRYTLKIARKSVAAPDDQIRLKAQSLSTEAKRQLQQNMVDGPQQALAKYLQASTLWESVGDREGLSQSLNSMGHIYHRLLKVPEAIQSYNRSLEIRQQDGDATGESECRHNLAALYSSMGETDKARALYRQALASRRAHGDELGQAQTLSNLGTICFRAGDFTGALSYFEEALPLSRELNARAELVQTMIGLGAIYHRFGDWQLAVECLEQNRTLLKEINYLPGLAFNQLNLGAVYTELGDLERAIATLLDVPELMRRSGSKSGEAAAWLNLGNAYGYRNKNSRALECYEKARSAVGDANDPNVQTVALVYTGRALIQEQRHSEARQILEQALERALKPGDRRWEAQARLCLGLLDQAEDRDGAAAEQMTRALDLSRDTAFISGEVDALLSLGELDRKGGRWEAAALRLAEGIRIIETMRSGIRTQHLRMTFFAMMQTFYDTYIDVLMQLHKQQPEAGHDAAALQASERARARLLVERLFEGGIRLVPPGARDVAGEQRRLQQRMSLLAGDPAPSGRGTAITENPPTGLRQEMYDVAEQYRHLQQRILEENPAYAKLVQPEPLALGELQGLLDAETALLEYKLGPDRSYLWVVTPDEISSYTLPAAGVIEASAKRFYNLLTERNRRLEGESFAQKETRIAAADRQAPAAAAQLALLLLQPAARELAGKRLVVVSEGILQWIPFEALPELSPAGSPSGGGPQALLVDRHEILYLPSAAALKARRDQAPPRRIPGKTMAIFADPVFDPADARVTRPSGSPPSPASPISERRRPADLPGQILPAGSSLSRLPFSRVEAEAISRLAPANAIRKALDFRASRAAVLDPDLEQYPYIHFATHGVVSTERPEWSGLVLSMVDEQGRELDGFLRLSDIYNLRVSARLVGLSACQTALGQDFKGEGLIGLTRGFMYAGAERVLASVWKVDDEATARLMTEFYGRVLGPKSQTPAQALREARLAIRRQTRWRAPHFWAGFILMGEWRRDQP